MQTYRVKLNTVCDEEVVANSEAEAVEIAKKQLEKGRYYSSMPKDLKKLVLKKFNTRNENKKC